MRTTVRIVLGVMLVVVLAVCLGAQVPPAPKFQLMDLVEHQVVFLKPGPSWIKDRPPEEQTGFQKHAEYVEGLSAKGTYVLGGPFLDASGAFSGAMTIVATRSPEEARRIASADPGVQAGLFTVREVQAFIAATGAWRPKAAAQK